MFYVVLAFIMWDISLHVVQLFKLEQAYWLYPTFATRQNYDLFWTAGYVTVVGLLILDRIRKH